MHKNNSSLIEIARISGAFGIKGYLRAVLFSNNLKSYRYLYNISNEKFSFKIVRYINGQNVILSISDINDRTTAESLKGTSLYINRKDMQQLSEDEFYICDLIGKPVEIAENGNAAGIITNVCNFGAGDLLEISYNNCSFFVPFTKENFPEPDAGNIIHITNHAFNCYKD